jgi:monothiol glutaredoxin
MRKASWMMAAAMALAPLPTAWAIEGDGLTRVAGRQWPRWQGRLSLGTAARAACRPDEPDSSHVTLSGASLLGDYYFSRSLRGIGDGGGFRATSGVFLGSRSTSLLSADPAAAPSASSAAASAASARAQPETAARPAPVPYLGVGYTGLSSKGGWGFSADVGLMALSPSSAVKLGAPAAATRPRRRVCARCAFAAGASRRVVLLLGRGASPAGTESGRLCRITSPVPSLCPLEAPMSDVQQRIDDLVKANRVVLFMKGTAQFPMCGFSGRAVQILKACGVDDLKTFNVLEDDAVRQGIKDYANWPTIPQLYVNGEFVGGSDIMMEMYQAGELQQVLGSTRLMNSAPRAGWWWASPVPPARIYAVALLGAPESGRPRDPTWSRARRRAQPCTMSWASTARRSKRLADVAYTRRTSAPRSPAGPSRPRR